MKKKQFIATKTYVSDEIVKINESNNISLIKSTKNNKTNKATYINKIKS